MVVFLDEMNERFEELSISNFTTNDIDTLKEFFREAINSNRRFEEISTVEELYTVLDDRDALTDSVFVELDPKFQKFVHFKRLKSATVKELVVPENVVKLICKTCTEEWETLGLHLNLTEEQLTRCRNVEDILRTFTENCEGVSHREMIFRLNRALKKCNKGNLVSDVTDCMLSKT